jgi:hypothetical protein
LWHRDGKIGYLADLPLVLDYVLDACRRYPELVEFGRWLEWRVAPLLADANARQKERPVRKRKAPAPAKKKARKKARKAVKPTRKTVRKKVRTKSRKAVPKPRSRARPKPKPKPSRTTRKARAQKRGRQRRTVRSRRQAARRHK